VARISLLTTDSHLSRRRLGEGGSEAALQGSDRLAIGYSCSALALFLIQNKLDPASDFIVTLLALPPTQMLIELAGILVSGLAF